MTPITGIVLFLCFLAPGARIEDAPARDASSGMASWETGQQALLDGKVEEAIKHFEQSLKEDPELVRNRLSLAAAYLAQGKENDAAKQLELYLTVQPDHLVVRGQYAELLLRLDRLDEAREQYERFEVEVQDNESLSRQQLVHCQSQLMAIAAKLDDEYEIHLRRGIGLFWLAAFHGDETNALSKEGLLCQAASELILARHERPEEARPCWYLHQVWSSLAQRQPATRWLRIAEEVAPLSYLTPSEQRQLHFASRQHAEEGSRK